MQASLRQENAFLPPQHPCLRVDLEAIRANYLEIRKRYRGRVLSAVVKSNAYGLGIEQVVKVLGEAGCRTFWVNDLEEAGRVRDVAPGATIYTLMGLCGSDIRDFEAIGATPALATLEELVHCARHAATSQRRVPVVIQIDTGLGRLGLSEAELTGLAEEPRILDGLEISLWVSQLAAYNLPEDPANREQRNKLLKWTARLPAAPISLSASSGIFMGEDWHFDVARAGSALFGVQTSILWQDGLRPCYELSAPLIRIADYPAGRRLGYRGLGTLARPSRIATAAIGYANGLPQRFADIGHARVNGMIVPVIGGLAMNMTMIDITDLPSGTDLTGTRAVFLDRDLPIEPVAERLGCAPNMLLTQIGGCTTKVYVNG